MDKAAAHNVYGVKEGQTVGVVGDRSRGFVDQDPHRIGAAACSSVTAAALEDADPGSVGEVLPYREAQVLPDPPKELGTGRN